MHDHTVDLSAPGAGEAPYVDSGPLSGPIESLVLDIGEDIGALIVYADESCLGEEIDLTPAGVARSHHLHTMIRRRRGSAREFVAGVFAEVKEGSYTLWGLDGSVLDTITITGGAVTEIQAGMCRATR